MTSAPQRSQHAKRHLLLTDPSPIGQVRSCSCLGARTLQVPKRRGQHVRLRAMLDVATSALRPRPADQRSVTGCQQRPVGTPQAIVNGDPASGRARCIRIGERPFATRSLLELDRKRERRAPWGRLELVVTGLFEGGPRRRPSAPNRRISGFAAPCAGRARPLRRYT
jgi:hypothetical protein